MLLELDMAAEPFDKRCRSCVSRSVSRQAKMEIQNNDADVSDQL